MTGFNLIIFKSIIKERDKVIPGTHRFNGKTHHKTVVERGKLILSKRYFIRSHHHTAQRDIKNPVAVVVCMLINEGKQSIEYCGGGLPDFIKEGKTGAGKIPVNLSFIFVLSEFGKTYRPEKLRSRKPVHEMFKITAVSRKNIIESPGYPALGGPRRPVEKGVHTAESGQHS